MLVCSSKPDGFEKREELQSETEKEKMLKRIRDRLNTSSAKPQMTRQEAVAKEAKAVLNLAPW